MKQPLDSNIDFEQLLQVLPENYQALAYELGAFSRARKVRSVKQLLQLILLYCGLDFSLRSSAAQFSRMQGYLSDTAVEKRLRNSVKWVTVLQQLVFQTEQIALKGNLRLKAIDGSTVQVPGAKGTSYRLHIAMNLNTLEPTEVHVSTDKQGESLALYALKEGDVAVVDRGYNQPRSIVPFMDIGGSLILRYNPQGMNLFSQDDAMRKIDWVKTLRAHEGQAHATPVYAVHENVRVSGFVHAIPLPPEQAEQARRKLREKASKKGRTPRADSLYLCGWVLIFSNLPLEILDTQAASATYRVRWQVELLIKRLKSLLDIDLLRAKKTVRSPNFICKVSCCMRRLSKNCPINIFMPRTADKPLAA